MTVKVRIADVWPQGHVTLFEEAMAMTRQEVLFVRAVTTLAVGFLTAATVVYAVWGSA